MKSRHGHRPCSHNAAFYAPVGASLLANKPMPNAVFAAKAASHSRFEPPCGKLACKRIGLL